jgi:hypothetical protein
MDQPVRGRLRALSARRSIAVATVSWMAMAGFAFARSSFAQDDPPPPPPPPQGPVPEPAPTDQPPEPQPPASTSPPTPPAEPVPPPPAVPPAPAASAPGSPPAVVAPVPSTPLPSAAARPNPATTAARPTPNAPPTPVPQAQPWQGLSANAPAAAAEPAKPADTRKDKDEEDDADGIFGPFRIGPVLGAGIPNLISFGGTAKLTRYLGFGLNIGLIPTVKIAMYGEATLSYQEYDVYGRIYPFGGGFFLGVGVGYETVRGTLVNTIATGYPQYPQLDITSEASVRSMVLTPQIGYFYTFGAGFSLGLYGGAQVPIAASDISFTTQVPNLPAAAQPFVQTYIDQNDAKVRDTLNTIGQTVVPAAGVQIGWLL